MACGRIIIRKLLEESHDRRAETYQGVTTNVNSSDQSVLRFVAMHLRDLVAEQERNQVEILASALALVLLAMPAYVPLLGGMVGLARKAARSWDSPQNERQKPIRKKQAAACKAGLDMIRPAKKCLIHGRAVILPCERPLRRRACAA